MIESKKPGNLAFWVLRTLNEIRTFFSENPNAEFWKTFKLGRAKRKGVGGEGIFARPSFSAAAEFRASEAGVPP